MKHLQIVIFFLLLTFNITPQWVYQNNITNEQLNTVFFIDSLYGWVGGLNGIILNTTDCGNNWTINSDTSRGNIISFAFINRLTGWAVTSNGKILKTTDGGILWTQQFSLNKFIHKITFLNSNTGYITASPQNITQPLTLFKTTNGGWDWNPMEVPGLQSATSIEFITENDGYIIGGFPAKIYKTVDGGTTWSLSKIDSSLEWFSATDFKDIDNGLLGGFGFGRSFLYQTTNGGQEWNNFPLYAQNYSSIIYKENKIWLLVGISPLYIIHSFDNGTTWFPEIQNITGNGILDLYFVNDKLGWAVGAYGNIYKTINGGYDSLSIPFQPSIIYPPNEFVFNNSIVWLQWNEIAGNLFRLQISTDSLFNNLIYSILLPDYLFTEELLSDTTYFWRLRSENPLGVSNWSEIRSFSTGEYVNIEEENINIKDFYLAQNYPNPFNSITIINFSIPSTSFITLKIFDVLGNEIRTLISGEFGAGNHQINFDGGDLSSGIYLYQLYFENKTISKKLILLK